MRKAPHRRPLHPRRTLSRAAAVPVSCLLLGGAVSTAAAQVTLAPYTSFGNGDGWLSPGEGGYPYLGTASNERGLAFGNGHLYLVSRAAGNNIRILNATTGADVGGLDTTGIIGGIFPVNMAATGSDGAIYVANLTVDSTANTFKIYKWATEASAPAVVYNASGGLFGCRIGDSLACIGSGLNTRLAAGYGATPAVGGNNGYCIVDLSIATGTAIGFSGGAPSAGDHRLGIAFTDATHVIGTQGMSRYRYSSFNGVSGTLLASPTPPDPSGTAFSRPMAYAVVGGKPLLSLQSTTDSHVSIFDVTNPATPIWIATGNNTSGALATNTNNTGSAAWTILDSSTAVLYTMSTNQGIQAFKVTVPSPCSPADLGVQGGIVGHDSALDNNDFVVFINSFFTMSPQADVGVQGGTPGHDGLFDNNDFVAFVDYFFDGCV